MSEAVWRALSGVSCPLVTPFADGSIDDGALESLIDHLIDGGIDGLFPCGTTGEFASLAPEERRRVIEATVDRADRRVPVMAGAAATSVTETLEYLESAAAAGADAGVVTPPYFHTANDPAGNRRFFEAVADGSPLPLVLYNIPVCTGRPIEPDTVAAVAEHDAIVGLKDSGGDLDYFLTVMRKAPEGFSLVLGYDALLVPALRMGADGGINALANVVPETFAETVAAADDERGRELQQEAIAPLFESCMEYGFAPATKAALVHRGVIPSAEVRPPLEPVPPEAADEIGEAVDRARS